MYCRLYLVYLLLVTLITSLHLQEFIYKCCLFSSFLCFFSSFFCLFVCLQCWYKKVIRQRHEAHLPASVLFLQVSVQSCECLNGASCATNVNLPAGSGVYICVCPAGFTGERCEVDLDDCKPNPCRLGRCIDGPNSFSCICPPGMTGRISCSL